MKHEWENAVKPQFSTEDLHMEYIVAVPAEAFTGKGMPGLSDSSRKPPIKNGRIHFARYNSLFEAVMSPHADSNVVFAARISNRHLMVLFTTSTHSSTARYLRPERR
jgi:hypothetical protein